jgi:hypothetical protein
MSLSSQNLKDWSSPDFLETCFCDLDAWISELFKQRNSIKLSIQNLSKLVCKNRKPTEADFRW